CDGWQILSDLVHGSMENIWTPVSVKSSHISLKLGISLHPKVPLSISICVIPSIKSAADTASICSHHLHTKANCIWLHISDFRVSVVESAVVASNSIGRQ